MINEKKKTTDKVIEDIIEEESAKGLITTNKVNPVNTYEHEKYFGSRVDLDKSRMETSKQKERRKSQNPYLKANF